MSDCGVTNLIASKRLVAILRLSDLSCAVDLSEALLRGGIAVQEFTLTNPGALDAISRVRRSSTAFAAGVGIIGAGSIRCVDDASRSVDAGAQFIVTPTLNISVIKRCSEAGVPIMSGAFTPTEILTAWDAGATAVKVFPSRSLGPSYVRDVLAPLPEIRLMPTGGVGLESIADYLAAGAFAVGVGGKLLDVDAVEGRRWDEVTQTARKYCQAAARQDDKEPS